MTPMEEKTPSQLLHEAVRREIAKGDVKASAEAWDVNLRTLTEIRSAPVNTGIETFAKICKGLGLSADELLGLKPPTAEEAAAPKLRAQQREFDAYRRRAERIADMAVELLKRPLPSASSKEKP